MTTQIERLQHVGIHRLGTPAKGFRYRAKAGGAVSRELKDHIRSLAIPPAWRDVVIAASPNAKLQALGRDKAGRWQYRYSPKHTARQETSKYERIVEFANALPKMRRDIARHIGEPGLGRDRVLATMLRILSTCFIRAGSKRYAEEHGSYGLSTLKKQHVQVKGDLVTFDYRGKSGQQQHRELRDKRVAAVIRALKTEAPGAKLFQHRDAAGHWSPLRRPQLNAYIKQVMGGQFSAKDFRTWAGTLICACALSAAGVAEEKTKKAVKQRIVAAIKITASRLGNTPSICKASYIFPRVLSAFEQGRVVEVPRVSMERLVSHRNLGLHAAEKNLLQLMQTRGVALH